MEDIRPGDITTSATNFANAFKQRQNTPDEHEWELLSQILIGIPQKVEPLGAECKAS